MAYLLHGGYRYSQPSYDQNKVGVAKEEHSSDLQTVLEKDASLLSDHEV